MPYKLWPRLTVALLLALALSACGGEVEGPTEVEIAEPAQTAPEPSGPEAAEPTQRPAPEGNGPFRPFPQHVAYTAGTILPDHVSQDELDLAVEAYYDAWKSLYLADDCGEGRYYVFTTSATGGGQDSISVSEGHGYGMIIAALMAGYDPDAQAIFDGLYRFFKDHPSVNSPYLMAWNQVRGCGDVEPGNTGSALDGDMDIAYALLLADRQWGSQGEIDYLAEALNVINAIMEHEVNPETYTLMLGDWVNPSDRRYSTGTRTSDFMFGHLRAFEAATGDARWGQVREATYAIVEVLQRDYSPTTGLLPDFVVDVGGNPRPADPGFLEGDTDGMYYYNACRTPWRIGTDYLVDGDPRDLAALSRLNAWVQDVTGGDPAAIASGYALDGSTDDDYAYTDLSFVAPLGVGAMAGEENQQWLNDVWDFVVESPIEEGGYYDNTLKMLALIAMSGNWWAP